MMNLDFNRVIVFSPHSDDSEIGAGGIIKKLTGKADTPVVSVLVTASNIKRVNIGTVTAEERVQEHTRACRILKAEPYFMGFDCETNLHLRLTELITQIEKIQLHYEADMWIIPAPSYHQDHRTVFEACISAARLSNNFSPRAIIRYELPNYVCNRKEDRFVPDLYVDIFDELKDKLKAIEEHKSQVSFQRYVNIKDIESWAKFRGFEVTVPAAEAFVIDRLIV